MEAEDIINVTLASEDRSNTRDVIVDGINLSMRLSEDEATFDMEVQGRDA